MEPLILKAARIISWLLAFAIVILSLVPPSGRPESGAPHDIEHFAIFASTGVAFGLGYGRRWSVAIALVVFAGAIEIAQLLAPGRHARPRDFIVDALAVCIGLAAQHCLLLRNRAYHGIRHRNQQ